MGKPDNPDEFVYFRDDDLDIYLARDIWEHLSPKAEKLLVAIQDYGRFWLRFKDEKPKRGAR